MIYRLGIKNKIDLYDFFNRIEDKYEDTYITINKERRFLKKNWYLIEKLLQKQEVYGLFNKGLFGILIVLHEKGFRPYCKILAENSKYTIDLLKYLKWNFMDKELFAKLKINNPLIENLKRCGFVNIGMRGKEILLQKKEIKQLYKITPKDEYLPKQENRNY
jgi:hypothetical protein